MAEQMTTPSSEESVQALADLFASAATMSRVDAEVLAHRVHHSEWLRGRDEQRWDEGHYIGYAEAVADDGGDVRHVLDFTNPYRAESSADEASSDEPSADAEGDA